MELSSSPSLRDRPSIFHYRLIPEYLQAMIAWHRQTDAGFSVRRRAASLHRCSHALVSQLVHGKRKLTLDRVPAIGKLLRLTPEERGFLEQWVAREQSPTSPAVSTSPPSPRKRQQNHLFRDWVNVYIWEASRLKGFKADANIIHGLLHGVVPRTRIERSLRFLLREGWLRRTLDGRVVQNDAVVTSTDEEWDRTLQRFHRCALENARRGIGLYPLAVRRESALVLALNRSSVPELKELLKEFYERLLRFSEQHLDDNEGLYQVLINLSPLGGDLHAIPSH